MKKILLQLAVLLVSLVEICAGDFENKFMNVRWVRDYYNEVILARNRNVIPSYVQKYKETPYVFHYELDSEVYWYEEEVLDKCEYDFSKVFDTYYLVVFFAGFDIIDIQKINKNMYQVVIEADSFSKEGFEKALKSGCNWQKENIIIEKFYLKFDGDYLYIYLNERTNLLATYCAYDESEYQALVEAIKTNNFDNMEFTFPRHADGSGDYDEDAWKSAKKPSSGTSLRTGKATTTKENLRVHSFDWATSPVRITLAAGTPVEILGVGGEETIDGITSKWVHVKVMPGTMGTDGTYIKWGNVVGWCFGGVISDMEETDAANAPTTKRAEPAEMVALPEAVIPKPAQNLFAEIRNNICGKTCAYFPKYTHVFAEIRLRFCGNKFEKSVEKCSMRTFFHNLSHLPTYTFKTPFNRG